MHSSQANQAFILYAWDGAIKMKIAVYGPKSRVGLISENLLIDVNLATARLLAEEGESPPHQLTTPLVVESLSEFLSGGERALVYAKKVLDYFSKNNSSDLIGLGGEKLVYDLSACSLQPPLTNTNPKIMCAGCNLADLALALAGLQGEARSTMEEVLRKKKNESVSGFYKQASSIVGSGDPIPYPRRTKRLDYEGEIALVIGKKGENIPASKYLDYTFVFAVFNDFSIRDDLIGEGNRGGFHMRKNFSGCGSLGPWITTKDEITNFEDFDIVTRVNGELRQNGSTKKMIKKFGEIVEHVSSDIILNPGDIITSGTCSGTAMDSTPRDNNGEQDPKLFLRVGDTVKVSSRQLGVITNRIVSKDQN